MAERTFFVIGGEYADTSFTAMADGREPEIYGPFSEKQARDVWRAKTAKTVDNALVRYRLKPADDDQEELWYVVGGEYADTCFSALAAGHEVQSFGPFKRAEALAVWRSITAKTVDSATARFNIVTKTERDAVVRNG